MFSLNAAAPSPRKHARTLVLCFSFSLFLFLFVQPVRANNYVTLSDTITVQGYAQNNTLPMLAGMQGFQQISFETTVGSVIQGTYSIVSTIRYQDNTTVTRQWNGSFYPGQPSAQLPTGELRQGAGQYTISFQGTITTYFANGAPMVITIGTEQSRMYTVNTSGQYNLISEGGGGGGQCGTSGGCVCPNRVGGAQTEWGGSQTNRCSPIIINLDGNRIMLTNAGDGVDFDFVGAGATVRTAWTRPESNDAFLVLDRNGNGAIDSGQELFGNFTPQPPSATPNGFAALAEFDKLEEGGNGDGTISISDQVYSSLRVWKDANHNGFSEPDELSTLSDANIGSISLSYSKSLRVDMHGNEFRYRSRVYDVSGSQIGRWVWDVFFVVDP